LGLQFNKEFKQCQIIQIGILVRVQQPSTFMMVGIAANLPDFGKIHVRVSRILFVYAYNRSIIQDMLLRNKIIIFIMTWVFILTSFGVKLMASSNGDSCLKALDHNEMIRVII
jgi:hypothetical protein